MLRWLKRREDKDTQLKRLLGSYELPTFPEVALRGLQTLRRRDATPSDVGAILEGDPGISAKLLSLVNSSAYGLRSRIRDVAHAVALLGRADVEALLLALAVRRVSARTGAGGLIAQTVWRGAAYRAAAARALATQVEPAHKSACFTAGLLSDMAIPLLCDLHGEAYVALVDRHGVGTTEMAEAENALFSHDHALVGKLLAEHWAFPKPLVDAVAGHHTLDEVAPLSLVLATQLETGCEERQREVVNLVVDHRGACRDATEAALAVAKEEAAELVTVLAA